MGIVDSCGNRDDGYIQINIQVDLTFLLVDLEKV